MIFSTTIVDALKPTLDDIFKDDTAKAESGAYYKKWLDEGRMKHQYVEDMGRAGPGLLNELNEGEELPEGTIREDYLTRYTARKFGMKLPITQEAIEDNQYPETLKLSSDLNRAGYKTVEVDTIRMLVRGFNTSYPIGDGQPLFSASHTLAHGGTFSNKMATAVSPSESAIGTVYTDVSPMPGYDGLLEGYNLTHVLYPIAQWQTWKQLLGSTYGIETQNFAKINTVPGLDLKPVMLPFWTNTTTNYAFKTDAPGGPCIKWRRKFKSNSWVHNSHEVMYYSISARWDYGVSNPRSMYGVAA